MPDVLQALSNGIRLNIVKQIAWTGESLWDVWHRCAEVTLSHHFRVLRDAIVLTIRREGKEFLNAIRVEYLGCPLRRSTGGIGSK